MSRNQVVCLQFNIVFKGSSFMMKVMPSKALDMLTYIKVKPKLDRSTVVIAPMPGVVKNLSAKVGQMVSGNSAVCNF